MANFNTAFGLCSITDSRGLLGVSSDEEGCVVVTLGKSMVIRCQLSDQKQLNSWSTTLAKLTSKVVWNAIDENYIGVFDNVYIKQWTKLESNLEKAKKHKFKNEVHEILLYSKDNILKKPQLVVLFKNGALRDLESALNNSKEPVPEVIQSQESIEMAEIILEEDRKYLIIVTRFENKYHQCYCVKLQDDHFLVLKDSVKKTKLRRQGSTLLGYTILSGEKGNSILTFWSDGFLYSLSLPLESEKPGVGKYLGAINTVSKKSEVAMISVSGDHIAIYGGDSSEEGAFLGIYNVKFGVIQAHTSFKMFNKPPRMWLIDNNLVVVMGQRLVCVPFSLQTETLSALVGSRALHADLKTSEICTIIPTATWEEDAEKLNGKSDVECPDKIKEQLLALSSEGWSEFGICQAVVTQLIESKDVNTLLWCLNNFTDISENLLVRMIQLALEEDDVFKEAVGDDLPEIDLKSQFLNKILTTPIDNFNLLKNLRLLFTFEDCLALIKYLCKLFHSESGDINGDISVDESGNVFEWTITLVDAFYQQFILSRDSQVHELIALLKQRVEDNLTVMDDFKKLMPYIIRLKSGKDICKKPGHSKTYSVERFQLYE